MEQYYASPIIAGHMVYLLDRGGTTSIVKASDKFELISESPLGEPAIAHPHFRIK
jgi:hypothetical protein